MSKKKSAGRSAVGQWFDSLERILHEEAELAGLLEHSTMIGNAREFFVDRALRSVLPPECHIGSGVVIGGQGDLRSKQVDVVIYDSRYPVLETQHGYGLYFAEGTIACIEVKSTLTADELTKALNNCASVLATAHPSAVPISSTDPFRAMELLSRPNPKYLPSTYVFGFRSTIKTSTTLATHIDKWCKQCRIQSGQSHLLPQIIVAGSHVGFASGQWWNITATDEELKQLKQRYGDNHSILMALWHVRSRFGWLLIDLLLTFLQRRSENVWKEMEGYLKAAMGEYFEEFIDYSRTSVVVARNGDDS
ncbi:MAG: hypothetical protein RIC55_28395 [Pirellulaceae bacterium]